MDLAIVLVDYKYIGSVTGNNEESYNEIQWLDSRKKPTWEELNRQWEVLSIQIKKTKCENKAKELIFKCDWSVLPDVNLQNKSDFENYRSKLRELIINPVENPVFPIEPDPIWSN